MIEVTRYWRFIFRSALIESASTLKKEAWKVVGALVVVLVAAYAWPGALDGASRILVATGGLLIVGAGNLLWKVISIPARLYKADLSRAEILKIAEGLEGQYRSGTELLRDPAAGANLLAAVRDGWIGRIYEWYPETNRQLRAYDQAEAFMFRTTEAAPDSDPLRLRARSPGVDAEKSRLRNRLQILREIIARAYARAGGPSPGQAPR